MLRTTQRLTGLLLPAALLAALLAAPGPLPAEAVPIKARPLSDLAIHPELRAPASVLSLNQSRISAEIAARITGIPVLTGQVVDKGAVVANLDNSDFQLALEQARAAAQSLAARVALARYELERASALAPKQLISEQVVKQREAELNALLAEQEAQAVTIRIAEANLAKTVLRAPFKALVIDRPGQVGALATPGTSLLEIVDLTQLEVSARIQTQLAASIKASTRFELEANGTHYALRLRTLVAMVDPHTRTREARLTFSGPSALPGSAGELVWQNPQTHIPADLVVRRDAALGVFTVVKGKAQFVALPGAEEGRPAPTTLAPDTVLVTEGRFRLKPGDAVEARP